MKNTAVFDDYDMVISISEQAINEQLKWLVKLGTLRDAIILTQDVDSDGRSVYKVLDSAQEIPREADGKSPSLACIDGTYTPQIAIAETGSNVTLALSFTGGEAWFWKGMGPTAKLVQYDMAGWTYGISITLDLAQLEEQDINKKIAVPKLVADQLHNLIDSMFTINHLFMDFESTDLLRFDPTRSDAKEAGDVGLQQLVEFMQFYLKGLATSGNPWILGYAVTAPDQAQYDKGVNVPDQLRPVGTTFTVFADSANPDLSSVNFVLVTKGGHRTVSGSSPTFDTNWMTPQEQCDGKLVYSHTVLAEPFVLQPFYDHFSTSVYANIKDSISVQQGNDYAHAKTATDGGYAFTVSNVATGDDQYVNTYTATFTNGSDADVALGGEVKLHKQVEIDLVVCTGEGWADTTLDWSAKVSLSTVKDASGNSAIQLDPSAPNVTTTSDSGTNECAKDVEEVLDAISPALAAVDGLSTLITGKDWMSALFADDVPGLGSLQSIFTNLGSALGTTLLLPAGGVFFFKNPSIDSEGNVAIELTYKAAS